jgi:hypothetical protein
VFVLFVAVVCGYQLPAELVCFVCTDIDQYVNCFYDWGTQPKESSVLNNYIPQALKLKV